MADLAVLIGLQASGKTTFYRQHLAATHIHVSKDLFPKAARRKQARQLRLIAEALETDRNVALDNTNPAPAEWRPLIESGRRHGAHITGYWFPLDVALSVGRNAARPPENRVPDIGLYATLKRLRRPRPSDGFDDLWSVIPDSAGGFLITALTEESPIEGP